MGYHRRIDGYLQVFHNAKTKCLGLVGEMEAGIDYIPFSIIQYYGQTSFSTSVYSSVACRSIYFAKWFGCLCVVLPHNKYFFMSHGRYNHACGHLI